MSTETFLSADRCTEIHYHAWLPEGTPRAVLVLFHGMLEHSARYAEFAAALNTQGFAVYAQDHLGHGRSVHPENLHGHFADCGGNGFVIRDCLQMLTLAHAAHPKAPLFLMGHSMGSFLTRTYLIRYPGTVKAAIIMGTGWQPQAAITGGLALANAIAAVSGENATSELVTELAFGSYNKLFAPNRTKVDWLSADESNVDDYIADPLCGADATVGLFRQMLHGIRFNQRQSHLRQMDREMPVLFVAGDKDPVGSCGKGVRQTYDAFRAAGMRDCTLKLYPGLRHEILNEKAYTADITKNIEAWLLSRLEK